MDNRKTKRWTIKLPKKQIVKVILSKEQRKILKKIAQKLGLSESEVMRMALMDYAKSISLIKEHVRDEL